MSGHTLAFVVTQAHDDMKHSDRATLYSICHKTGHGIFWNMIVVAYIGTQYSCFMVTINMV